MVTIEANVVKNVVCAIACISPPYSMHSREPFIATGMAIVKNILSEKSDGSSASSAVSSTVSTLSTAQVTPLLDDNRDQLAMATYDVNGGNQRVYVVESDITDVQRRVQVSESESSF